MTPSFYTRQALVLRIGRQRYHRYEIQSVTVDSHNDGRQRLIGYIWDAAAQRYCQVATEWAYACPPLVPDTRFAPPRWYEIVTPSWDEAEQ